LRFGFLRVFDASATSKHPRCFASLLRQLAACDRESLGKAECCATAVAKELEMFFLD
jgi:hypothetical protein